MALVIAIAALPPLAMAKQHGGHSDSMQGKMSMHGNELTKDTISEIQQSLNNRGFHAGNVDGLWGPKTKAGLMNFQRARGLDPTGQMDTETMYELGMIKREKRMYSPQQKAREKQRVRDPYKHETRIYNSDIN